MQENTEMFPGVKGMEGSRAKVMDGNLELISRDIFFS